MTHWDIVLAGAIVPVFYGDENTQAFDVYEMLHRREGKVGDGVYVRPQAVLAVVKRLDSGSSNVIGDK